MSLAKYYEDNMEIGQDRMYMKYRSTITMETIFSPSVVVTQQTIVHMAPETVSVDNMRHDIYIFCKDCGRMFRFPEKSQKFFEEKGWCRPKRCKACREFKKVQRPMRTAS